MCIYVLPTVCTIIVFMSSIEKYTSIYKYHRNIKLDKCQSAWDAKLHKHTACCHEKLINNYY